MIQAYGLDDLRGAFRTSLSGMRFYFSPNFGNFRPNEPSFGNFRGGRRVLNSERAVNDDAQWIEQALAGQTAAFGQLVRKYQDRLYNTLLHVVGNAEDARDIVQDALVQAFLKLDTFRQDSTFYTWLYRIGFNVAATHRRLRKSMASVDQIRDDCGADPADQGDGPSEQAERRECVRQVHAALAELNDEYRAILVLREIDGCCYETIAEVLDLPVGTVRSRLHRARIQLREQLKETLLVDD